MKGAASARALAIYVCIATAALGMAACSHPEGSSASDAPTRAEYEAALVQAADCIEDQGFSVEIVPRENGITSALAVNYSTNEHAAAAGAALDRCTGGAFTTLERAYLSANVPTGAKRDGMLRELAECLEDAGVQNPSSSSDEAELLEMIHEQSPVDRDSAMLCMARNGALFAQAD
jgi:hypothetical protein